MNQETAAPEEKTVETVAVQDQPFAVGDVVSLKSGGGRLTVSAVEEHQIGTICISDSGSSYRVYLPLACFAKPESAVSATVAKMTNMDMLKDFVGDVLSYVVAIFIAVKLGITSSPSEPMRPFTVVALLCVFLGFALAKKYFYNRSK